MDKRKELKKSTIVVGTEKNTFEYEIVDVIGNGANSIVYDARYFDSDNGYHSVRIKECYPYMSNVERIGDTLVWENETQKERDISNFKNAYHKLLKVQNDSNVSNATAHVFDLIEANGTLYSIMDATVGTTFDNDKNNNLIDILKTVCALAKVVGKYHNNGYLHLDIKPSNFLTIAETRELVILFDVDTVTLIDEIQSGKINNMSFSNGWAAPEQMQGKISKLCPATDIFSIGAILFEKTMGRKVLNDDMSPFANWEFEGEKFDKLNPKIKRLLHTIFHKTLSANIKRRYQSCDELIAVLDEAISISSVKTFIVPSSIQSKNFIGRKEDLNAINVLLQTNSNVFIHGFAGTGKTELAREYAIQNKEDFDTIVFCRYNGSLISSLQRISVANFEDYKENFKFEFEKLCNDDRLLIILDNFDVDADSEQYDLEYFLNLNCKKIITTRTNFSSRNDAEIYHLECLVFDDALELFKFHSKIHEFSNEDILEIKTIFAKVAYNTLFICRLAKEISSRGLTISKLAINVMTDLLKNVGKAEVYKDGKVSNTTIYDLAKILFKLDELSSDQLQVMRNLYMLRWRTVNLAQYREIACFNMDEVTEERIIDTLLSLESRGYIENSQSGTSNREIYLHSIVAELIDKDYESNIDLCKEIKAYYSNYFKKTISIEETSLGKINVMSRCLHELFDFYDSLASTTRLGCTNEENVGYIINEIYKNFVLRRKYNSTIVSLVESYIFFNKTIIDAVAQNDDVLICEKYLIYVWLRLAGLICDHYSFKNFEENNLFFKNSYDSYEDPAIDIILELKDLCLSKPSSINIKSFFVGVDSFNAYFYHYWYSGNLKKQLKRFMSFYKIKEESFDKIDEAIKEIQPYIEDDKQKKVCDGYYHNFSVFKETVEDLKKAADIEHQNSIFAKYMRVMNGEKRFPVEVMFDDAVNPLEKIKIVHVYYFANFHIHKRYVSLSEIDKRQERFMFLENFLIEHGDYFDKVFGRINEIRFIYALLNLHYDTEKFKSEMETVISQAKKSTCEIIEKTNEKFMNYDVTLLSNILNGLTANYHPFKTVLELFDFEGITREMLVEYHLPYLNNYLEFCEKLFSNNPGIEELRNSWYVLVRDVLFRYVERFDLIPYKELYEQYETKLKMLAGIGYSKKENLNYNPF